MLHSSMSQISQEASWETASIEANQCDHPVTSAQQEETFVPTVSSPASESCEPIEPLIMHQFETVSILPSQNSPSVHSTSKSPYSNTDSMANPDGSVPNLEDLLSALHERRHLLLLQQQNTTNRQKNTLPASQSSSHSTQFLQGFPPNLSTGDFSNDSWSNLSQFAGSSNNFSWNQESHNAFSVGPPNQVMFAPERALNSALYISNTSQPTMPSMLLPDVPHSIQPHQQTVTSPSFFDLDCSLNSSQLQPNYLHDLPSFESLPPQNSQFSFPSNANPHVSVSSCNRGIPLPKPLERKNSKRSSSVTDYEPVPASQVTPKVAKLLQEQNAQHYRASNTMRSSRASSASTTSLLHTTCKLFPHSRVVVESALQFDPESISLAIPTLCSSRYEASGSSQPPDANSTSISNYYSFPINIALQYEAAMDVIQLLVDSDPSVLTKRDGPNQTGSLSIALSTALSTTAPIESDKDVPPGSCKTILAKCAQGQCAVVASKPCCGPERSTRMDQLVALLLRANRESAMIVDRRNNTALHYVARCKNEVSPSTITLICSLYPEALHVRNWLGQTPLQVAQRNLHLSDNLLEHWIHLSYSRQEYSLEQSLKQIDVEIEVDHPGPDPRPMRGCNGSANANKRASSVL